MPKDLVLIDLEQDKSSIRIIVDSVKSVDLDTTAYIAKKIRNSESLNKYLPEDFQLEVSSPGIDSPLTHATVAEAKVKVDAARQLLHRAAEDIHASAEREGRMTRSARARIRMDCAFAVRLCLEAGEGIFLACGGSGLAESNPIQRAWRDLHAINKHALLQLQTNSQIYGRVLLGLEPGTDIL